MINTLSSHTGILGPLALRLVCMTDQAVRRCIDAWRDDERCTEVLTLGRLPPRQQQPTDQGAAATDQSTPFTSTTGGAPAEGAMGGTPQPSTSSQDPNREPTEEEQARDAIGQKVLDATLNNSVTEADGTNPPYNDNLRQIDLQFNQDYGYSNMEGIVRCLDYGELNGGLVPLTTQQRGACLFHAFRKSLICPREFTNTHLHRMVVSVSISGNYGHIRLSRAQYEDLRDRNLLTAQQREEYLEPGPFSIITYMENLLKPNFYGEEKVLRILSMIFQVRISVLNSNTFIPIKIRHVNRALKADVVLVHVDRHHYIPLGKIILITCILI